jgi:UDP-N-acetylmuramoyl-L-alanyl-D-glutamate--2,6-diaminopimelate ligase
MQIQQLLQDIDKYVIHGNKQPVVAGLSYDSRSVKKGDMFFCIKGYTSDGHLFAEKAVKKGASVVVTEHWLPISDEVTQIVVKDTRLAMAIISANYYGNPSRGMKMLGITGTNGKTTTTYMIKGIGEAAGKKVGLIGTIKNMIGDEELPAERTTPESMDLQALLARMRKEGVDWVVMEVSSHALELKRVAAITFDVGVFTNMTQDHLDFHQTFEQYREAKRKLFDRSRIACVNTDDDAAAYMLDGFEGKAYTFGLRHEQHFCARDIDITPHGVSFCASLPEGEPLRLSLAIPGIFSVYNALSALSAAYALGVDAGVSGDALCKLTGVDGRFESLPTGGRPFHVILDYAHSPDGLDNILNTAKSFAKGRIVTLFGCGGDRDQTKRPVMGEIAGRHSDFCVITSDNPRTEEPYAIMQMIEEGMKRTQCAYIMIENRREAIRYVLGNAQKDDIIILAGKGHETYQEIHGIKNHFDEKEIVSEILAEFDTKEES